MVYYGLTSGSFNSPQQCIENRPRRSTVNFNFGGKFTCPPKCSPLYSSQEHLEFAAAQSRGAPQECSSSEGCRTVAHLGISYYRISDAHFAQWALCRRDTWKALEEGLTRATQINITSETRQNTTVQFWCVVPVSVPPLTFTIFHPILVDSDMFHKLLKAASSTNPHHRYRIARNDAGRAYNTWPKMLDDWVPPEWLSFIASPIGKWRALFEETAVVQFNHRMLLGLNHVEIHEIGQGTL